QRIAGVDGAPGQAQLAVCELRVAQAVPKWIKRLSFEVAIGPALHRVALEVRKLTDTRVERDRQPACRIVLAAQGFRYGSAALFARIESLKDRVGVVVDPVDGECA